MHNSLFLGDNILENKLIKIQEYDSGRFLSVNLLNNVFFSEHGKILARILPSFAPRLASLGAVNVPWKNIIHQVSQIQIEAKPKTMDLAWFATLSYGMRLAYDNETLQPAKCKGIRASTWHAPCRESPLYIRRNSKKIGMSSITNDLINVMSTHNFHECTSPRSNPDQKKIKSSWIFVLDEAKDKNSSWSAHGRRRVNFYVEGRPRRI